MPGPLMHIYTARRVADFLANPAITNDFIRNSDEALKDAQKLAPGLLAQLGRAECASAMQKWPKFMAVGANELEQIQLLLGHASVQTTERYLGIKQDLVHAPNDAIKLKVAT